MSNAKLQSTRTRARELLLQALYQRQMAGHSKEELLDQFHQHSAYERSDKAFFDESLAAIVDGQAALEKRIDKVIDRPREQLDPVELAILLIGFFELESRSDIPYRVVINEGVNLAKRFGAVDGHKYINACLDAAARSLRSAEVRSQVSG